MSCISDSQTPGAAARLLVFIACEQFHNEAPCCFCSELSPLKFQRPRQELSTELSSDRVHKAEADACGARPAAHLDTDQGHGQRFTSVILFFCTSVSCLASSLARSLSLSLSLAISCFCLAWEKVSLFASLLSVVLVEDVTVPSVNAVLVFPWKSQCQLFLMKKSIALSQFGLILGSREPHLE